MDNAFPFALIVSSSVALILVGVGLFIKMRRLRTKAQLMGASLVKVEEVGDPETALRFCMAFE